MALYSLKRLLSLAILFLVPVSLPGQTRPDAENLHQQAVELYREADFEKSKKIFSEIENEICSTPDLIETCISGKMYRAGIEQKQREFELAETILADAEGMINENLESPHPLEVKLYKHRVALYVNVTHFDKAQKSAEKALELAEKDKLDKISIARAYLAPAFLEDELGNYKESFQFYSKAVETLEHVEENREKLGLLSQAYNNMGILLRQMGRYHEAMDYYQKGLEVAQLLHGENHPDIGLLYNNIGGVYYGLGDLGQAADYFLRAATIFRDIYGDNHAEVAAAYNNVGVCYLKMFDYEKGVEMLERAQRIKEELLGDNHLDTAMGYSNLASVYLEDKKYEEALENFQKSLVVRKQIYGSEHPNLITPYIKLGEFYSEIEEYSRAREYFREALQITKSRLGQNHPDMWEVMLKIGDTFQKEKQYEEARENYEQAYDRMAEASGFEPGSKDIDAGRLSHPLLFMIAATSVGDIYLRKFESDGDLMNLHQALDHYSTATSVVDFLQHSYQSDASKLNLFDENYSIFTNSIKACHKLYEETLDEYWLDEILRISEGSRSRIALELLQNMEAKKFAGVPDGILERENSINSKIAGYYQKLHAEQEKDFEVDEEIISAYRDSLFDSRQTLAALTEELEQKYPDYYQLKYDQTFADRETVSNLMKNDETLLNYIISEDEIYALVMNAGDISFHSLGSPDSLSSQIQALLEAVSSNDRQQYSRLAFELYNVLLDPIMPWLETKSLIIAPDQILYYLPFEMLLTEPTYDDFYRMPYLIREKQISYVPSATVLQKLSRKKNSNPKNLLAVAPFTDPETLNNYQSEDSRYIAGLSSLPLTRYETREIAEIFRQSQSFWNFLAPEKTEILTGQDATKSAIENTSFVDYGYIHFATHAFVNEESPALSGIAFWSEGEEDGVVYVNDIYNMKMNADLVTLGACETGLGTVYKGEGMIGFTRAFMYAGASNLLVSMWRVNDQSTANLMINFYRYARDGHSYSESLQMAKMDLIEQPEFASPRNWAAFVLQGR